MAYELGSNVVVNQIGNIPEETDSETRNLMLSTLADLGKTAQHVGAFLAARTGTEDGTILREFISFMCETSLDDWPQSPPEDVADP